MTKKQKIWLAVFLAMFLVPEILWSPIFDFYYQLYQTDQSGGTHSFRQNFLDNSDNVNILKCIISFQLFGLLSSLLFLIKSNLNKIIKIIFISIFLLMILVVGFAVYFAFNFNPQIG